MKSKQLNPSVLGVWVTERPEDVQFQITEHGREHNSEQHQRTFNPLWNF